MITYKQYQAKEFTHAKFYNQFVTPAIGDIVVGYIGESVIKNSLEERFSDIPLLYWDRLSDSVLSASSNILAKTGTDKSLSIAVCIAKAAARRIRGF